MRARWAIRPISVIRVEGDFSFDVSYMTDKNASLSSCVVNPFIRDISSLVACLRFSIRTRFKRAVFILNLRSFLFIFTF